MKLAAKLRGLILFALLVLASAPSFSQGCAMCKAAANATPKDAQRAINGAILVMLAPPLGCMLFGGLFVVRYVRRRDLENEQSDLS